MLISKLLRVKKLFTISTGEQIVDLISSSFNFGKSGASMGVIAVNEYDVMRPDNLSQRLYATQEHWDILLKFNGISNPFSLDFGEILLAPPANYLQKMITPPKTVPEKGSEVAKKNESATIKPKSKKDEKMLDAIRIKVPEVVPPNVNMTGAQNIKVENGRVILGASMTTSNSTTVNQGSARARVQSQLQNNQNL